jgi:sec-independent protein translocase protein TatB
MFGLGMGEIIVILIVALLVLGPDKLPDAAKQIGKGLRELRKHTRDLQDTVEKDEHIGGTIREIRSALRDEPATPVIRKPVLTVAQGEPEPPKPEAETAKTEEKKVEPKADEIKNG